MALRSLIPLTVGPTKAERPRGLDHNSFALQREDCTDRALGALQATDTFWVRTQHFGQDRLDLLSSARAQLGEPLNGAADASHSPVAKCTLTTCTWRHAPEHQAGDRVKC